MFLQQVKTVQEQLIQSRADLDIQRWSIHQQEQHKLMESELALLQSVTA
jgi:hypothetical protein